MKRLSLFFFVIAVGCILAMPSWAKDKADLSVQSVDVVFAPDPPLASAPMSISVTVHNIGTKASAASKVSVKLFLKGVRQVKHTPALPAIPAGGSATVNVSLGQHGAAFYALVILADPGNTVPEIKQNNNKVTIRMQVLAASPSVGQGAAAIYGLLDNAASSALDSADWAMSGLQEHAPGLAPVEGIDDLLLRMEEVAEGAGGVPEEVKACSRAGAYDYTVVPDGTGIRPGTVTVASPAQDSAACESWLYQDPADPALGIFARRAGVVSMDLTYLSDDPRDDGFLKLSSAAIRVGSPSGEGDQRGELATTVWIAYRGLLGIVQERILLTRSAAYTLTLSVLGYGADGKPNHIAYALDGSLSIAGGLSAAAATATFTGFVLEGTFGQDAEADTLELVADGSVAVTNAVAPRWNFAADYQDLAVSKRKAADSTEVTVEGAVSVSSTCIEDTLTFHTNQTVVYGVGQVCPSEGDVVITTLTHGGATLHFNADGSLSVDVASDGTIDQTYGSCTEAIRISC